MRLLRVLIPVTDIGEAKRFYSYVLNATPSEETPAKIAFDVAGVEIACVAIEQDDPDTPFRPNRDPIQIAVRDVEAAFAVCRTAGGKFPRKAHPRLGALGDIRERPNG
ncbi:MAG: VOC family protein, partial [Pseudomonadota bacterium]